MFILEKNNLNNLNKTKVTLSKFGSLNFFGENTKLNSTDECSDFYITSSIKNFSQKKIKPVKTIIEALPELVKGCINIEKKTSGIKSKISRSVNILHKKLTRNKKTNINKNDKKIIDIDINLKNDVFLYSSNGQGYYYSNQKVFNDAKLLKGMPNENVLKYEKFLEDKFDLDSKNAIKKIKQKKLINDNLTIKSEKQTMKVNNCLDKTEEMKRRIIYDINNFIVKNCD